MAGNAFLHDPQAVLDYKVDWTAWLGSDTIASSTWTVPAGITKNSDSATTTAATIWMQGGTDGTDYTLVNHITTAGGRQEDQSIVLKVRSK